MTGAIAVSCVQCRVEGKVHFGGQSRWTLGDDLQMAKVAIMPAYSWASILRLR